MNDQQRKLIDEITLKLADEGRLIEGGWEALRLLTLTEAPPEQVREMRKAFFAGAQHLFASIMGLMEPDAEPTDADMGRMTLINDELEAWRKEVMDSEQ